MPVSQRPHHAENTSSRLITAVKQRRARSVPGWETAWEPLVLLAFWPEMARDDEQESKMYWDKGRLFKPGRRQRPHRADNTSSRPITAVKQRWARLVLGWVTAWESLVLLSF